MCKSNRPFIPANDYSEFISLESFAGMNGRLDLRIITQPYSEVYWGYFRSLVFGNSLTKHIKLSSFSYSVVIFPSRFPTSDWAPCNKSYLATSTVMRSVQAILIGDPPERFTLR